MRPARQILVGDALHVGRRHRERLLIFGAEVPGIAVDGGAVGELERLAEIRLEPAHERQFFARRRLLHFFGGRPFALEPLDDGVGGESRDLSANGRAAA